MRSIYASSKGVKPENVGECSDLGIVGKAAWRSGMTDAEMKAAGHTHKIVSGSKPEVLK